MVCCEKRKTGGKKEEADGEKQILISLSSGIISLC